MPTIREISQQAGVSKSTVSLVLNNKSGVSEAMRRRVLEAVEILGEVDQKHSRETPLSVLLLHPPTLHDEVFTEYLQGIWAGVAQHNVQLHLTANEPNLPPNHITNLVFSDAALRPDGLIILGAKREEPLLHKALALDIPCVSVHREKDQWPISTVGVDEAQIAYEATQHLLNLGHRAIAFVGGDDDFTWALGRLRGYRQALEEAGVDVPEQWVFFRDQKGDMETLLAQSPGVTALVCANDTYALDFAIPAIRAAGYQIPNDFSVIGFDNLQSGRKLNPPLSSVSYPRYQEGLRVVSVLVEQMTTPTLAHQHIVFRPKLHIRASCAEPRSP